MRVSVYSEIGRLREGIVHRPGRELMRMTPGTREHFLFDDLLYTHHAQMEHDWFTALLTDHLGVKIHSFHKLLTEALEKAPAPEREKLLHQVCLFEIAPLPMERRIAQLEDEVARLRQMLLSGQRPSAETLEAEAEHELRYLEDYLARRADEGQFTQLAGELIEGIEARNAGVIPGFENPEHWPPGELQVRDRLTRFVQDEMFHLPPLPNLMFVRDAATVVANRLVFSRMAALARRRETLLFSFVTAQHPRFAEVGRWPSGPHAQRHQGYGDNELPYWEEPLLQTSTDEQRIRPAHAAYIECGNIVTLAPNILAIGISPRTTMPAVQRLINSWEQTAEQEGRSLILYVLRLPEEHNHLDTVFTRISVDECVLYSPVFEPYGSNSVDVIRIELGAGKRNEQPVRRTSFIDSLADDGVALTAIPCGGDDPTDQQREEWFSGANMLTLAPGKVITYRSTRQTVAELVKRGYREIDSVHVLDGGVPISLDDGEKWVLSVRGSELSRGHGGPHSLVMPLVRD